VDEEADKHRPPGPDSRVDTPAFRQPPWRTGRRSLEVRQHGSSINWLQVSWQECQPLKLYYHTFTQRCHLQSQRNTSESGRQHRSIAHVSNRYPFLEPIGERVWSVDDWNGCRVFVALPSAVSAATSDRTVVECSSLLLGVGTTLKKLFCCLCKMFMRRSDVAVDVDQYKYHMRYASIVLPNVDCLYVGVGRDNRQV